MIRTLRPLLALFLRAVRDDVRAKFPPIMRTLAVLFVLLVIWGNQRNFNVGAGGQIALTFIALVNLAAATLFGLGSFSSAITEEKEDETMGLLRMTRLNPLAILLGKSTARLAGGLLFIGVQIPFVIVCIAMGGVAMKQVLMVYAILSAYLVFLCNLCLLASVLSQRSVMAVALSLGLCFLIYVAPVVASVRPTGSSPAYAEFLRYMMGVNPLFHTLQTAGAGLPFLPFGDSIRFHLMGAGILFLASWACFNHFCSGAGAAAPKRRRNPEPHRRRHGSRPGSLALAWKEFRYLTGGWGGLFLRTLIYAVLAGGLAIWIWDEERSNNLRNVGMLFKWCGLVIFTVELGSVSARIFGAERQQQTLGGLMGLPISMGQMIWQKVAGCLLAFLPSLTLWWLGVMLYSTADYRRPFEEESGLDSALTIMWLAEYVLFPVLVASLSLRMRRGALLSAFGLMLFGNILAFTLRRFLADDYYRDTGSIYLIAIGAVGFAGFLGTRIPAQLAACAAEN